MGNLPAQVGDASALPDQFREDTCNLGFFRRAIMLNHRWRDGSSRFIQGEIGLGVFAVELWSASTNLRRSRRTIGTRETPVKLEACHSLASGQQTPRGDPRTRKQKLFSTRVAVPSCYRTAGLSRSVRKIDAQRYCCIAHP